MLCACRITKYVGKISLWNSKRLLEKLKNLGETFCRTLYIKRLILCLSLHDILTTTRQFIFPISRIYLAEQIPTNLDYNRKTHTFHWWTKPVLRQCSRQGTIASGSGRQWRQYRWAPSGLESHQAIVHWRVHRCRGPCRLGAQRCRWKNASATHQ